MIKITMLCSSRNVITKGSQTHITAMCQKFDTAYRPKPIMQMPMLNCIPTRNMSRVKRRHTRPPFWLPKTTRTLYPEDMTSSNESFVSEMISEQYKSPLRSDPWERGVWTETSTRCGVIARKIGVYPMWTKDGKRLLTTLLQVWDNHVIKYIPPEELVDYRPKRRPQPLGALVVGAESIDPRKVTKEYYNLYANTGLMPKKKMTKFLVTPDAKLPPGTPLYASHYRPGFYVDIAGTTIDRGFQGVMKRWGFHGMPASHGVTKSHRRPGNIGSGAEKSRVLPGQKMPGHMGREKRILRGLMVWRVNTVENVLWVQGPAIPGHTGAFVTIYDSWLHHRRHAPTLSPPFPTCFQDEEDLDQELYHENLHNFTNQSLSFSEK